MRKLLFVVLVLCGLVGAGSAQTKVITGEMTLSFGYVTTPDGKKLSVAGVRVPYRAELCRLSTTAKPQPSPVSYSPHSGDNGIAATKIYENDSPDTFATPGEMPSALDDLILVGATSTTKWTRITIGITVDSQMPFLVRWRIWDNFTPGLGAGIQAFFNEKADFGGILPGWPPTGPNEYWRLTISLTADPRYPTGFPVPVPDNECFFATQFRSTQPDGQGPFNYAIAPVFCGGGAAIGSSEDLFWYDYEDGGADGIYAETEQDYYGGAPWEANVLAIIEANAGGSTSQVNVGNIIVEHGTYVSGSALDLQDSDDFYYELGPARTAQRVAVIFEALAPTGTIRSVSFNCENAMPNPWHNVQTIEMFNYSFNRWDTMEVRGVTKTDFSFAISTGANFAQYVASNRRMRTRVTFSGREAARSGQPRIVRFDKVTWTVVTQ